jgi:hypothetical protein
VCLAAVGEAFATWDVDVTSEDPGFEGLERCVAETGWVEMQHLAHMLTVAQLSMAINLVTLPTPALCCAVLKSCCHTHREDEEDEAYGIRMCVGGSSDWTNTSIAGIATLNSFGWINKPGGEVFRDSFVFSQ